MNAFIDEHRAALALAPDRGPFRQSLRLRSEKAVALARGSGGALEVDGVVASAGRGDIPLELIANLVNAGVPEAEAWSFYDDSLHLYVFAVFPDRPSEVVDIPARLISLLAMRRAGFEDEWGVELRVLSREARLTIAGDDKSSVRSAAARVRAMAAAPRLSTPLPLTDVQLNTRRAEGVPSVFYVWADKRESVLTAIADTRQSAELALRTAMPARGVMIVADGLAGRIVGPQGERIRQMKALTACDTWNERGDPRWIVSGPTVEAIGEFFRRALEFAPGSTFSVIESGVTHFVPDALGSNGV